MVNINRLDFDDQRNQPGFVARRARVGQQAGARRLGLSLWEVEPGQAANPYHVHMAVEELIVVLEGRPSVRTPIGWEELEPGDVVSFLAGEVGAHQLVNRTEEKVRFLAISTAGGPEILLQPDSGKLGAYTGTETVWFRQADAVPYFDGENRPDW